MTKVSETLKLTLLAVSFNAAALTFPSLFQLHAKDSVDLSGSLSFESRYFPHNSKQATNLYNSFSMAPELYVSWNNDKHSLLFAPYFRLDSKDDNRTHFDIRELTYVFYKSEVELRLGIRKLFWGVTESNHLVDIINQTDAVENPDLEDKLGQPMINVALVRNWGTVDFFILTGFRERTFSGEKGRPNSLIGVRTKEPIFESASEKNHIDYAVRYSTYGDFFDFGIYHFWGTSREPSFVQSVDPNSVVSIKPFYEIIHQTGIDFQATAGNTLYKFESIRRSSEVTCYYAFVGGFEHTLVGLNNTTTDLGFLMEYSWDERGKVSTSIFNNDIFIGNRFSFNDTNDTNILAGVLYDLSSDSHAVSLEMSRRLRNNFKLEIELRLFQSSQSNDPLHRSNRDDYLQIEIFKYF